MKEPNLYQEYFKQIDTLSFILDENGFFIDANQLCTSVFGFDYDKITKYNILSIDLLKEKNNMLTNIHKSWTVGKHIFEFELFQNNKLTIPYEVYAKKVQLNNIDYLFCNAHTIFNSKEVENKILSAVIETEEKERSRFAKDLHDGLGPLLSTIKLYVHELDYADIEKKESKEYINYIIELLDEAVTNTRDIANNLTPQIISTYGLVKSIDAFKSKVNATNKVLIDFTSENILEDNISKTIKLTLFRIITELINNTLKHAFADHISIKLYTSDTKLILEYKDDGIGFDFDKALKKGSSGIGLVNIINRIKSMSGEIDFKTAVPKGVNIEFSIQLDK